MRRCPECGSDLCPSCGECHTCDSNSSGELFEEEEEDDDDDEEPDDGDFESPLERDRR